MGFSNLKQYCKEKVYLIPGVIASGIINLLPSSRLRVLFINAFFYNSSVDKTVTIHRGFKILMMRNLKVGKGSTINSKCFFDTRNEIIIGENAMIGHAAKIYTLGHDYNCKNFSSKGGGVHIKDNVVIFSDVKIMPNVVIGCGAVAMSASVLTRPVEEMSVVGGNPAIFIKKRVTVHDGGFNYRTIFAL